MKTKMLLSLVVVGVFLLSGFGVVAQTVAQTPRMQIVLSKPRAVESYTLESSHPYANNYNYTWTITKTGATSIRVRFYQYETESGYDYIYILDRNGNQLARYHGGPTTNVWSPWSNSDTIKVRLYTDYSVTKWGFKIDQREYNTTGGGGQNDAGTGGDAGNDFSTATQINPSSYNGYLDSSDRNDYYKFNVNSGQTISVTLTPPSSADFDLYLYNPSGTQKASSTAGTGAQDSVTFTADSSGYWAARMYEYSGSGTYSFTVSVSGGGDTTPPTISSVQASSITTSGATITWTTNEASSSVVEYGTTTSYGSTATGTNSVTSHSVGLSGLSAGTTYHYRVKSADSSNNLATSGDYTFATTATSTQNDAGSGADAGNTFDTALQINSGSYSGYMDSADGNDYYKFNVNSGQTIQVSMTPPSGADFDLKLYNPSNTQKASSTAGAGTTDSVTFTADSSGYWRANIYYYSGSGTYSFTVSVTGGGGGGGTLGDAVDNTALTWTTGGNANWAVDTSTYYYGTSSAKSGTITHSQNTYIQTTVTGAGTLTFYWKVSSEASYDFLRFYIDGTEQSGSISGSVDWQQKSYSIASGSHTLKWAYTKDGSVSSGSDCGWLDKVVFTAGGGGGKYAVIVGINDYNYISDLSYCVNDANDWKPYLETQGYTISSFLTNSQANETAIKNAIANAISQAGSTGTVAFIFAGHGGKYSEAGLSGEGSVCYCYDGSLSSGTTGNLQDTELQSCFSGYTGKVFVFLDSCRSGGMNEVVSNDPNGANRYMTTTCGPNGYGYDEPSYLNGAWTYWFLEKGLVNSGSGHTYMEGNFNWAKNNYPYSGDDAPMQFDGNTSSLFYL